MSLKLTSSKIIWTLFYSLVFVFLLYVSFANLDPDLGWHLRVGQEILDSKSVPTIDHYTYTLGGKNWVDHEWLSNAAFFFIFSNFNYIALNIIFALLMTAVFFIFNWYCNNYFFNRLKNKTLLLPILILLEILGLLAIAPSTGARVQTIGVLFLLLLLISIEHYEKSKNWKTLLWLIPFFYLWSCLHGSFLIGIVVVVAWIFIKTIEKFISNFSLFSFLNFKNIKSPKEIATFAAILLFAITTTIFTPYGLGLYLFLFDYKSTYYMTHIMEWLPPSFFPISYFQTIYIAIVIAAFILYFLNSRFEKKVEDNPKLFINLWRLGILLVFFVMELKSRRHFPFFFIVSLPIIVEIYIYEFTHLKIDKKILNNIHLKIFIAFVCILLIIALLLKTNFTNNPFSNQKFCGTYPCAAIQMIKNDYRYKDLKIFNEYDWGGYMIWTWPEKKLFIDGRFPQYSFEGHTMLEDFHDFFNKENVEKKLRQHDIKLVLSRYRKPIKVSWWEKILFIMDEKKMNEKKDQLWEYLDNSGDWKIIFDDQVSRIYLKLDK